MNPEARNAVHANTCKAAPEDSALLSALAVQTYTAAFGHSIGAADLAAHLETNLSPEQVGEMLCDDVFLLARVAGETVGFVQFGDAYRGRDGYRPFGAQPGDEEVRRLYILAAFQNCGVGSSLMNAALASLAGKAVFLDVWEDNAGAQRFYGRYGFQRVGERAFHTASGDATGVDLVMVRRP